jgi:Protein of unknown function (DUF3365)
MVRQSLRRAKVQVHMSSFQQRFVLLISSVSLMALLAWMVPGVSREAAAGAEPGSQTKGDTDRALERTREQVKMLDDLYKNAVVSITKRYVSAQDGQPAIMVAQDIFGAMKKQGWHSAKLVDATGEPMSEANAPQTDFEKEAKKEINSGKAYFERVVGEGKDRRLLAATVVPVVMKRCADCHTHKKVGEVLGFIRYDIPIK